MTPRIILHGLVLSILALVVACQNTQPHPAEPETKTSRAESPAPKPVPLIRDGQPIATLVIPDEPLPVETAAAEELRYHVEKATGASLPVVAEADAPPAGPRVYLGKTARATQACVTIDDLPPNSFVIRTDGQDLLIRGVDSPGPVFGRQGGNRTKVGTLFGVYHILDTHLGVRWIFPGEKGLVVPPHETILADGWDVTQRPPLRMSRYREGRGTGLAGWVHKQNRETFLAEQGQWLRRHRFALGENLDLRHHFAHAEWWQKYHEDHPEIFNQLPDGTHRLDPTQTSYGGSPNLVTMSVAEPKLHKMLVEEWLRTRSDRVPHLDTSENDALGRCVCPKCLAWDEPDPELVAAGTWDDRLARARAGFEKGDKQWPRHLGSLSDRYARYYRAVLDEAMEHDPDAIVLGRAYSNYTDPPIKAKLHPQIILQLVPHFFFPITPEKRAEARAQWLGWAGTGAKLMLRPNYPLSGGNMPIYWAEWIGEDLNFHFAHDMIAWDFDSLNGMFGAQGFNHYMIARLNHDPSMSPQAVMDEWFASFGPAEAQVRAYVEYLKQFSASVTQKSLTDRGLRSTYHSFQEVAPHVFTEPFFARALSLMNAARQAAQADPAAAKRVQLLQFALWDARLTCQTQLAWEQYQKDGKIKPFARAVLKLDRFRADHEEAGYANMHFNRMWEKDWPRGEVVAAQADAEITIPLPTTWKFAFDPGKIGHKSLGWNKRDFDDADWAEISTETHWERQAPGKAWKAEHGEDYDGRAWYRVRFDVPADAAGRQAWLLFGAVDEAATGWLNGQYAFGRPFPYKGDRNSWKKPFVIDVTPRIEPGKTNVLSVLVTDSAGGGGIWKPVTLLLGPKK